MLKNTMKIPITLLLTIILCPSVAEIFSSTVMLRKTLEDIRHFNMKQHLVTYIGGNRTLREQLQPVLDDVQELDDLVHSPEFWVQHPVHAYKFIRLQEMISESSRRFIEEDPGHRNFNWPEFEEHTQLVTQKDVKGLVTGLVRIQTTYQLKTSDMADGKVGEYPSTPLTAAECLDFASYAKTVEVDHVNALQVAAEWMQEARRKVEEENDDSVNVLRILEAFMLLYQKANCQCSIEALEVNATIHTVTPHWRTDLPQPVCGETPPSTCRMLVTPASMPERFRHFNALCRQEPVRLSKEMNSHRTPAHKLRCRYVHQGDPRLLLQPVKLEELNTIRPYIAILHDIVTEGEIDFIKQKSPAEFKRGTVRFGKKQKVSKTKISQTMKLAWKHMKKDLRKLRGRLQALTRLNIRSFERIQVANYGTGGFYGFHVDLSDHKRDPDFSSKNNRLVTMVMYLTDVEAGGQTCFPTVGVVAPPKKGNALLFRNLHRNGTAVNESTHTSCPVMVGEKWIANQWVRVFNQEFHFPCSLDPNE